MEQQGEQVPSFYAACVARNIPTMNHASDLYIPATEETTKLLKVWGQKATTFINQINNEIWFDVPFAFQPFWDAVIARN